MPRGTNPTEDELEFFFDCFNRGLSNIEVKKELQGEEFPLRDIRTIKKYREMNEAAKKAGLNRNLAADPIAVEQVKRHSDFLIEAVALLKAYMGQASHDMQIRWTPTDVDELRIRDLLSHLENPDLEETIRQATQVPPHDDKRDAAQLALGILQHVLLRGVTSGRCEHCQTTARLG